MSLARFIIYYTIYCIVIALAACILPVLFSHLNLLAPKFWVVYAFVAGITFIAYLLAWLGMSRNPETGVMAIMASIALKMLFSMAFLLIYSLQHKGNALIFVFNFFSLYLLFSGFEILCLLRNLRHQNKK